MPNPWLEIPLADYEGHMASRAVDQARLVAAELGRLLRAHAPASVAVLGCSGGNGFDAIDPHVTRRVVAVDINPAYVDELTRRFGQRVAGLETHVADVQRARLAIGPVALVYAALVLEFVDLEPTLSWIRSVCAPGAVLATLIQLPSAQSAAVTPSPYASLQRLAPLMRLVPPDSLTRTAARLGFVLAGTRRVQSPAGKAFRVYEFRASG